MKLQEYIQPMCVTFAEVISKRGLDDFRGPENNPFVPLPNFNPIHEILAFFMGPMAAPAMALRPEAARAAAFTIPMYLFVNLHVKLSIMQRAVRQTHTDATVGAWYAAQSMDILHHAISQVRAISTSLMAACDMALLLATALSVLDKATHTITHEDEPEYSSNADTLSILPADTVGVYTFLQSVYQERAQSPLQLIAIPNGTPKRLAAYPIDAGKHKSMRVSASSHGLPPPSSGESNPTTRWTGPFSKTRPSTKQVPRKGKDSYRHP
jgi:hypothetical protein